MSDVTTTQEVTRVIEVVSAGPAGPHGKSAYQHAVDNGFVGTEVEWVATLGGIPGPKGDTGNSGSSAYQVAVAAGFVGTEAQWLASLVGPQGVKGDTGDTGLTGSSGAVGPQGPQGNPGSSAYQVAVAGGFVGTEAAWLASLVGPQGPQGPAGSGDMLASTYDTNGDGKVNSADSADAVPWSGVTGKPSTFAPSAHSHTISDVTGLQTALDGKQAAGSYAAASHSHAISEVTGLQTALDGKAASGHSHGDATTGASGFMSAADKAKLDGVASGATNYTHPANHSPSIITQDANNRFVTDAEKATWNGKGVGDVTLTGAQTLTNKTITGYTETVYTLTGTVIDPANGTVQTKTLSANTTFTESLADGQSVILMLNPSTYTTTWPSTVWIGTVASTAPTLIASVYNCLVFFQMNGTLYGRYVGRV